MDDPQLVKGQPAPFHEGSEGPDPVRSFVPVLGRDMTGIRVPWNNIGKVDLPYRFFLFFVSRSRGSCHVLYLLERFF